MLFDDDVYVNLNQAINRMNLFKNRYDSEMVKDVIQSCMQIVAGCSSIKSESIERKNNDTKLTENGILKPIYVYGVDDIGKG